MDPLLEDAARRADRYLARLGDRPVAPDDGAVAALESLREPLSKEGHSAADTLELLDRIGSPATIACAGPRYFGFVTGGALPATVAGNWLATAWDQNAGMRLGTQVGSVLEEVVLDWCVDLLGLPSGTTGGLVSGATMANLSGIAAARHHLLARTGWDVQEQGLFGAPELRVVVGDEVHASVLKALALLGLGRARVERVPVDAQGAMRADALPALDERTIVCVQAGNVNTGAFDPATEVVAKAREAGAWVHTDGAFGLWVAVSPNRERAAQWQGYEGADSWATDAHKWLNVPYDSGLVFCRHPDALRAAMTSTASYLLETGDREPSHWTPEMSRRARGVEVWAALRSLGRVGLGDMVERCCRHASRFADGLREAGYEVRNDVRLNQVLVSFGDDAATDRVLDAVQRDGTCWAGGSTWRGRRSMRISVSSWATGDSDVEKSLAAILRIAAGVRGS